MKVMKELFRALRNHRYDETPSGLYFPNSGFTLQGVFDTQVNDGPVDVFPNMIVNQWREQALNILFGSTAKITTFYLAPFAGNVTPTASWTASNFASNATEFTNYTEASRQTWTVGAVNTSDYSIGNSAAKATFTVGAGVQTTIWGVGLLSAQAKSATSGVLVAANKSAAARDNLVEGDQITIGYSIILNNAS